MNRPSTSLDIFCWVGVQLRPSTRLTIVASGMLAFGGYVTAIGTGWLVGEGQPSSVLGAALVTSAFFGAGRLLAIAARASVSEDLYTGSARALLRTDVLSLPAAEPHVALNNGIYHATTFLVATAPAFVAQLAATAALLALFLRTMSARLLFACAVAAIAVGAITLALRGRADRLQERVVRAQQQLGDALHVVLHARTEIVAQAHEAAALHRVSSAAAAYADETRRSSLAVAAIGRAPIIGAALLSGWLFVALGGSTGFVGQARGLALIVAAAPSVLGALFNAQELIRARARLQPFARIILRPSRPDYERTGKQAVSPAPITFDDVDFAYNEKLAVLTHFTSHWFAGALVLRGANGGGKSTALRLVAGLRSPNGGAVCAASDDLRDLDLLCWRRAIGFLPQQPYLGEPYVSVAESCRLFGVDSSDHAIRGALSRVGLEVALDRAVGTLSTGQRQRVAIARVLARNADLLLLDEPDANLDAEGIDRLVAIIEEEVAAGKMVAVAAHGPIAERLKGTVWEF